MNTSNESINFHGVNFSPEAVFRLALEGDTLYVAFGAPAQNNDIVPVVAKMLQGMIEKKELAGGPLLKVNGAASLPVAVVIAHAVLHLYETVAIFDPKLSKYVVSVSHGPSSKVGDLID